MPLKACHREKRVRSRTLQKQTFSTSWLGTHGGRTETQRLPPISLEMRQKPQREEETGGRKQGHGTWIPSEHGWRHRAWCSGLTFTSFSAAVCLKPPPAPIPCWGHSETSWLLWFSVLAPREAGRCLCAGAVTAGAQGREKGQGQTHPRKPPHAGSVFHVGNGHLASLTYLRMWGANPGTAAGRRACR